MFGKNFCADIEAQHCLSLNRCSFIFLRTGGASSAANVKFWIHLRNMAMVFLESHVHKHDR